MLAPCIGLWQVAVSFSKSRGSSGVEHALGKGGVGGSIPLRGTIMLPYLIQNPWSYPCCQKAADFLSNCEIRAYRLVLSFVVKVKNETTTAPNLDALEIINLNAIR